LGLNCRDDDIFTAFSPPATLVQHFRRFSDPRSVAKEYFEMPALFSLFFPLDFPQNALRIPVVFSVHLRDTLS
jgi:hypothetical protein